MFFAPTCKELGRYYSHIFKKKISEQTEKSAIVFGSIRKLRF
jgi:hypothetical protein